MTETSEQFDPTLPVAENVARHLTSENARLTVLVDRLREENRSLVQTIRRVLRAEPVDEQVRSELVGMIGNRDRLLDDKAGLLKVLEGWLQLHSFPHMPEDVFEMADQTHAAIAKAKGVTER